jgi:hypothetical protein
LKSRDVDLAALPHVFTTFVHDLASRLVCQKCKGAGKRPSNAATAYAAPAASADKRITAMNLPSVSPLINISFNALERFTF